METKKVTLNNGTVLEVGKEYYNKSAVLTIYFKVIAIGWKKYFYETHDGSEGAKTIDLDEDALPYTTPTPQKEWKTFLIEFSGIKYRAILQYETLEQAQFHHPNAISITEVRLNIEEVK